MKEENNGPDRSDGRVPADRKNSKEARPTFPDIMGPYPTEETARITVPHHDADQDDDTEGKKE